MGNALEMPFDAATFDGAYSMFVSMNIAEKSQLYGEIHRVLRPGGWLVLSEIARGDAGEVFYPTPWAATAAQSFLSTIDDTRDALRRAGFYVEFVRNDLQRVLDFGARSRAAVERGEKPPYRANALVHGDSAGMTLTNVARGYAEGSLIPIEVVVRNR